MELPLGLRLLRRLSIPHKLGFLERLYGRWLASKGIRWTTTSIGRVWKLDLVDVCDRWIVYGDYEGSTQLNWIRSWLVKGSLVIDSGANHGQMAVYFSAMPGVRVVCVEPVEAERAWLLSCLEENHLEQVSVQDFALGAADGTAKMRLFGARSSMWIGAKLPKDVPVAVVEVRTLDRMVGDLRLDRVRLWKLDVEGWEIEALKGARNCLANKTIEAILFETAPMRFPPIRDLLTEYGYASYEIQDHGLVAVDQVSRHRNLVALPMDVMNPAGHA